MVHARLVVPRGEDGVPTHPTPGRKVRELASACSPLSKHDLPSVLESEELPAHKRVIVRVGIGGDEGPPPVHLHTHTHTHQFTASLSSTYIHTCVCVCVCVCVSVTLRPRRLRSCLARGGKYSSQCKGSANLEGGREGGTEEE